MQVPDCPNVLSAAYLAEVAAGDNITVCTEQEINLNGSAIALYNDTSYYDDLTFAATWLYRATGDSDYLSQAETWYVAHLYGTTSTSSVRPLQPPSLLLLLHPHPPPFPPSPTPPAPPPPPLPSFLLPGVPSILLFNQAKSAARCLITSCSTLLRL